MFNLNVENLLVDYLQLAQYQRQEVAAIKSELMSVLQRGR